MKQQIEADWKYVNCRRGVVILLWAGAALVAVAPAIGNGFPLVYYDTTAYVLGLRVGPGHPPFYGVFVWLIATAAPLLAVPIVQGVCAVVTLELALRSLAPGASAVLRASAVFTVVALTQVPWLASWIMPDLFGGLGVVAVVALLIGRAARPSWEAALLLMMALFSALVATANVLIFATLAILCLLARRIWLGWRVPPRLVFGTCTLAFVAFALPIAWNWVRWDVPRLNAGSGAMMVSKLVDAGIAQRYLADNCHRISHPLCTHREELREAPPRQRFLWIGDPPLAWQLNAWRDPEGVFSMLASSIVRTYPGQVLRLVLNDTLDLSTRLTLGFNPFQSDELASGMSVVRGALEHRHGSMLRAFDEARQQAATLEPLYPTRLYQISAIASYGGVLLMLVFALLQRDRHLSAIAIVTIAAVLLGLAVHGGLVGAYARYHVKVSWLACFALIVWALSVASDNAQAPRSSLILRNRKPSHIVAGGVHSLRRRR